jgi:nucleoside 2-deoxyribosyltransferase
MKQPDTATACPTMIYLAGPYSHPDPAVREQRYREACRVTAGLLRAGRHVFSPIVHGHPLVEYGLPSDWEFWRRLDQEHLRRCDEVVVLMLDGWRDSAGVRAELQHAQELGLPVSYLDPTDDLDTWLKDHLGDAPGAVSGEGGR